MQFDIQTRFSIVDSIFSTPKPSTVSLIKTIFFTKLQIRLPALPASAFSTKWHRFESHHTAIYIAIVATIIVCHIFVSAVVIAAIGIRALQGKAGEAVARAKFGGQTVTVGFGKVFVVVKIFIPDIAESTKFTDRSQVTSARYRLRS